MLISALSANSGFICSALNPEPSTTCTYDSKYSQFQDLPHIVVQKHAAGCETCSPALVALLYDDDLVLEPGHSTDFKRSFLLVASSSVSSGAVLLGAEQNQIRTGLFERIGLRLLGL